jgi:hypothetical protein
MNPFRKNVLVLFGASLLIAMSVGSTLGAKPTSDTAGPRGQTISDFVHSVITGDQEVTVDETPTDEAPADEAPADEAPADEAPDCTTDEDATDEETTSDEATDEDATEEGTTADEDTTSDECATDEDATDEDATDEDATDTEDTAPTEQTTDANAHGTCVSDIATTHELTDGPNDNHGGAVSLAARETCPNEGAAAASDTAADVQAEMTAREQAAADRAAAKEARKADKEARKADKATAREARLAARAASVHGKSATHGGGHGH